MVKNMSPAGAIEGAMMDKPPEKPAEKPRKKKEKAKARKRIKELSLRRAKNGFIVRHHFAGKEPMPEPEEHILSDSKAVHSHMDNFLEDLGEES